MDGRSSSSALCYQYLSISNQIPHFIDLPPDESTRPQKKHRQQFSERCVNGNSVLRGHPYPQIGIILMTGIISLCPRRNSAAVAKSHVPGKVFENEYVFFHPPLPQQQSLLHFVHPDIRLGDTDKLSAFWYATRAHFMTYSGGTNCTGHGPHGRRTTRLVNPRATVIVVG